MSYREVLPLFNEREKRKEYKKRRRRRSVWWFPCLASAGVPVCFKSWEAAYYSCWPLSSCTDVIGTKLSHTNTHRGPISSVNLQGVIYLPSAGLLISCKHLSARGGRAAELAGLPLKTHHNTFIYQLCIPHTFSLFLYLFLPTIYLHSSSSPPSYHRTFFSPTLPLLFSSFNYLEIHPQPIANKTTDNNATTLGKWHATARCNYNVPSILHLSFHLPNLQSLSLSLSLSLLLSAISAAAIAAKFYRVSHLNRQNTSPGIQPQWAACLPASYLPIKERSLIRLKDHQPLGRMTHKETQTNIYLLHKHPLLLFNCGPPESPGLNPLLLGGKNWKRYPCYVVLMSSLWGVGGLLLLLPIVAFLVVYNKIILGRRIRWRLCSSRAHYQTTSSVGQAITVAYDGTDIKTILAAVQ